MKALDTSEMHANMVCLRLDESVAEKVELEISHRGYPSPLRILPTAAYRKLPDYADLRLRMAQLQRKIFL